MILNKEDTLRRMSEVKSLDNDTVDYIIELMQKEIIKKQGEFLALNDEKSMFKLQGSINSLNNFTKELYNLKLLKAKILSGEYTISENIDF